MLTARSQYCQQHPQYPSKKQLQKRYKPPANADGVHWSDSLTSVSKLNISFYRGGRQHDWRNSLSPSSHER